MRISTIQEQMPQLYCERLDKFTGDRTYIYHGNDGTNMPWNDTAQLDLMKAEVRESLIQTIMHVARKTPIIRFDAAMTLSKKTFSKIMVSNSGLRWSNSFSS